MTMLLAAALALLLLCSRMTPAFAACVNASCTDTASIEQARASIQATCGCTRAGQTPGKYRQCVKSTLRLADLTVQIPQKACRKLIMKCENGSICGKPNAAVCCTAKGSGKVKASIVGSSAKCKKGTACGTSLGFFSKFDACAADGTCAGPPTTTTTSTTTSSTVAGGPTTTTTSLAGGPTTSTSLAGGPTTTTTSIPGSTTSSTTTTLPSVGLVLQGALTPTPGRFNYNLMLGLPAANSACNANFAGSHACTYAELQSAAAAGDLAGLTDTASTAVTSFWAIDPSQPGLQQCIDDVAGGSGLNWEYGTAHTASRGQKVALDNAAGTLGPLQSSLQCNFSTAWVGCCR